MEHVDAELAGWPQPPLADQGEVDANYKRMLDVALDPRQRSAPCGSGWPPTTCSRPALGPDRRRGARPAGDGGDRDARGHGPLDRRRRARRGRRSAALRPHRPPGGPASRSSPTWCAASTRTPDPTTSCATSSPCGRARRRGSRERARFVASVARPPPAGAVRHPLDPGPGRRRRAPSDHGGPAPLSPTSRDTDLAAGRQPAWIAGQLRPLADHGIERGPGRGRRASSWRSRRPRPTARPRRPDRGGLPLGSTPTRPSSDEARRGRRRRPGERWRALPLERSPRDGGCRRSSLRRPTAAGSSASWPATAARRWRRLTPRCPRPSTSPATTPGASRHRGPRADGRPLRARTARWSWCPPWNFPLAIPAGGVLAALAAGQRGDPQAGPGDRGHRLGCWPRRAGRAGVPRDLLQFVACADDEPAGG